VGAEPGSGVANPDFEKLAAAFYLGYARIDRPEQLEAGLDHALAHDGPILCEVRVNPQQAISPKMSSFRREDGTLESRPLEDMAPFLSRDEIHENMHMFDDDPPFVLQKD
jgi:acetolactate synthase-1/2/3 large subunit